MTDILAKNDTSSAGPERKRRNNTHAPIVSAGAPRRRGFWWITYAGTWLVTLSLLAVAASRITYHDGAFPLIWLNAFTRYVYLPAYVCLAWSAWHRRWLLAAASAAVVFCHVAWIAPDFLQDRRFDDTRQSVAAQSAKDAPAVRIFFANVREDNGEYQAMLQEIERANPDVIVLVEYGWGWHSAFKDTPIMKPYFHGTGHLQSHIGAVNVFSRLPLKTEAQDWIGGRAVHAIDIELGAQTLRLIGLHGPRPIDLPRYHYREYWQEVLPFLLAQQGPLVIVGDFNVTQHSHVYQLLTEGRLRSAHEDRGRGYATTWPNGKNLLPPIRIDQALLSSEIECTAIAEGRGVGSDHKPIIVDVRIRQPQIPRRQAAGSD